MFKKKSNVIIALIALVLLVWLGMDLFKQGNPKNLPGGFTEVATYRNENNVGPVQLIYIVTVADTAVAKYEAFGEMMPHFKYGNTKVYFFPENRPFPKDLSPGDVNFSATFNPDCVARFEKFAMGNSRLLYHPFK